MGFKKNDFPNAIDYYNNALSLSLFVNLKKSDLDKVISELKRIFVNKKKYDYEISFKFSKYFKT